MDLKKQIRKLLALEALWSLRPGGGVWVLLLSLRGFSLAQIGLAEGVFHLVSLFGELPSGLAADLLGRRRVLAASQSLFALSSLAMLCSRGMGGVLLSMALSALGYNLASGTREAITYDSLLQMGEEKTYLSLSAKQNTIYRLGTALSTLLAGVTVALGWRAGYGADLLLCLAGTGVALSLTEPAVYAPKETQTPKRLGPYLRTVGRFLRSSPDTVAIMLFNALVGAGAVLLGFYLQDALPAAGAPTAFLGPLLLAVGLGGAAGSQLAIALGRLPRWAGWGGAAALVIGGYLLAAAGAFPAMALGGFLAGAGDDALELQVSEALNRRFPSSQRATLISVSSLCFSLTMVFLAPLGGILAGS